MFEAYHVLMVCKFLHRDVDVINPSEIIAGDRIECLDSNRKCPKKKIRGYITPHCWRLK